MQNTRSTFRPRWRSGTTFLICSLVFSMQSFANSLIYKPLTLPKAEDIVAFANEPPPGSGARLLKSREEVLKFLKEGQPVLDLNDWDRIENADPGFQDVCKGVLTDKSGKVYYWDLRNANALKITTQDNETALLQLHK